MPNGKVEPSKYSFDGTLDGENVILPLDPVWTSEVVSPQVSDMMIPGTLKGNTLTLVLVPEKPVLYHRATRAEFIDAYRSLQMRAAKNGGAK
jgi:hypothetical protein